MSTIQRWLRDGVPKQYESLCGSVDEFKTQLDKAERTEYGGNHQDMFPDTLGKDAL